MTATLSSRPGTKRSANQLPPNSARRASRTRATASVPRTTDESSMPSDACSKTDFTIHGPLVGRGAEHGRRRDVGTRASRFLAASLCDVPPSASAEQPVNGTPSDSSSAGTTCTSWPRPSSDSTRLTTACGASSRRARSSAPRSRPDGHGRRVVAERRERRRDGLRLDQRVARVGAPRRGRARRAAARS